MQHGQRAREHQLGLDLADLDGFSRFFVGEHPILIYWSGKHEAVWIRLMSRSESEGERPRFEVAYYSGHSSIFFHYDEVGDADEARQQAAELREIADSFHHINSDDTPLGTLELGLIVDPAFSIAVFDAATPDGLVPVFAALRHEGQKKGGGVAEFGKSFSILEAFSFLKHGMRGAESCGRC